MDYIRFLTDETERLLPMHVEDKDKYLVLTCAKNEDKYLVEFVEHYLKLGFDKVIIADNNDEPTIEVILDKFIKKGQVEIYDFRGVSYFQVQLYRLFANKGNYKWCAYFDADEFLEIGSFNNIKEFLEPIKENCVLFHWLNFGSNGEKHYKKGSLQERFRLPVSPILYFKENCFVKSIVRGGDYWKGCHFNGSHLPYFEKEKEKNIYNSGGYETKTGHLHCFYPIRYKYAYLKHYYTKSFDEWLTKSNRGWPDGTPNLRTSTFFGFENIVPFDFDKIKYAAFGDSSDYYDNITRESKFFKETTDDYSVIHFVNESKLVYSLIVTLTSVMKVTTDHTYIVSDEHIDDILYGMLLECAYHTGNRLLFCKNHDDVYRAFLKYKKEGEDNYYIIYAN
jgi:hypothetical protein